MKLQIPFLRSFKKINASLLLIAILSSTVFAATYTVNTEDDDLLNDCTGGGCNLRGAIAQANANVGDHTIDLAAGSYEYTLSNGMGQGELPSITRDNLVINMTGGDFTLDGSNLDPGSTGLQINANNVTVRGITVKDFDTGIAVSGDQALIEENTLYSNNYGIAIDNSALSADGEVTIRNNEIGFHDGNTGYGNNYGIYADEDNGAYNFDVTIEDNTLAYNERAIEIDSSVNDVTIENNTIQSNGDDGVYNAVHIEEVTGHVDVNNNQIVNNPEARSGVQVNKAQSVAIRNNRITGNDFSGVTVKAVEIPGQVTITANTIGENGSDGIVVEGAVAQIEISDNFVGIDNNAQSSLGNNLNGIRFSAQSSDNNNAEVTIINNVVSNNTENGIRLEGLSGKNYPINLLGNIIGLAKNSGEVFNVAAGNTKSGISLDTYNEITIGGPNAQDRNVISANAGGGIVMDGIHRIAIENNYIGTDETGTLDRGNGATAVEDTNFNYGGILLSRIKSSLNASITIGGEDRGNLISGNYGQGVFIGEGYGVEISHNTIGLNHNGTGILANKAGSRSYNLLGTSATGYYQPSRINGAGIILNNLDYQEINGTKVNKNIISGNVGAGIVSITGQLDGPPDLEGDNLKTLALSTSQNWNNGGILGNKIGVFANNNPAPNQGYNIYFNDSEDRGIMGLTIGGETSENKNTIYNKPQAGVVLVDIPNSSFDDETNGGILQLTSNNNFTYNDCPAIPYWEHWVDGVRSYSQKTCATPSSGGGGGGGLLILPTVLTSGDTTGSSSTTESNNGTQNGNGTNNGKPTVIVQPTNPPTNPQNLPTSTTPPTTSSPTSTNTATPTTGTSSSTSDNTITFTSGTTGGSALENAITNYNPAPLNIIQPTPTAVALAEAFANGGTVTPQLQETFDTWVSKFNSSLTTSETLIRGDQEYSVSANTQFRLSLTKDASEGEAEGTFTITPSTINDQGISVLYYMMLDLNPFTEDLNDNGFSNDYEFYWNILPNQNIDINKLITEGPQITNLRSMNGLPITFNNNHTDNRLTFRLMGQSGQHEVVVAQEGANGITEITRERVEIEDYKGEYTPSIHIPNGEYFITVRDLSSQKFTVNKFTVNSDAEVIFEPVTMNGEETQLISGKTNTPGAVVFVAWKSVILSSVVIADANGEFELQVPKQLPSGQHEVIVYSYTDRYDRQTSVMSNISRLLFRN